MKLDKSSIFDVIATIIIIVLLLIDDGESIPYLELYLPILWIFFVSFDIYKKRKYLRNIPENEVRISNNNDSYFNALPFISGCTVCLVSLLLYFIMDMENKIAIVYSILGLVLLIDGLQIIPTVVIKVQKGNLEFESGKVRRSIPILNLNSFIVSENEIRLYSNEVDPIVFQHLELPTSEIELTTNFLNKYIN